MRNRTKPVELADPLPNPELPMQNLAAVMASIQLLTIDPVDAAIVEASPIAEEPSRSSAPPIDGSLATPAPTTARALRQALRDGAMKRQKKRSRTRYASYSPT